VSGLLVIDAPYQPRSLLPQLLAAADIHLASLKQGVEGIMVPSKLYGILAAGRPIVYVGGASGEVAQVITESGCGVVVAPGDWATFCAAISRYLSDPDQRQREGSIGQRIGERCWGFERALDRWRLLVQEIATKGSGR
jgi:glycosyltransferase involved in cell wall biosynthesis